MTIKNKNNLVGRTVIGALMGAAVAGFNHLAEMAGDTPVPVLGGEQRYYPWRSGRIFYHVDGAEDAPPMVLIHGFHAAGSSFEWRYTFDYFVEKGYRVYAPDLLGFGLSDRPAMLYDDELFIALIGDFLRDVVQQPAVVIATSVGATLTIAAAARNPERFEKLVLIAPVGLGERRMTIPVLTSAFNQGIATPIAGEAFFNLLTTATGIRYFMNKFGFYDSDYVTDELVDHHFNLAHMPNARYAPAAFISGALNRDISDEWASLRMPLLLVWGHFASTPPPTRGTDFLKLNPRAVTNGYDSKLWPQYECARAFNSDTLAWLEGRRKE